MADELLADPEKLEVIGTVVEVYKCAVLKEFVESEDEVIEIGVVMVAVDELEVEGVDIGVLEEL